MCSCTLVTRTGSATGEVEKHGLSLPHGRAKTNLARNYEDWKVNGKAAGQMRQVGNLHFLRVFDAGHMVPMDQPENAYSMLTMLLEGNWDLSDKTEFLQ